MPPRLYVSGVMRIRPPRMPLHQSNAMRRKKMAETEAKWQLQYAKGIAKAVEAAEERINAHVRKLKAVDRKEAEATARAQEQESRQERVTCSL